MSDLWSNAALVDAGISLIVVAALCAWIAYTVGRPR